MYKVHADTSIDFYKSGHIFQYPDATEFVYSNLTPRSDTHTNLTPSWDRKIVWFGNQAFMIAFLIDAWNESFFEVDKEKAVARYKRRMDTSLGPDTVPVDHIAELHDLGYLPLHIKSLPEGTRVPIGVPPLTLVNTHKKFFWLTNYIESIMSAELWRGSTSATTAFEYRRILNEYAAVTGGDQAFIQWQGHDFSFRGMGGSDDAKISGAGHLLSFTGTDTVPAIDFLEDYYSANADNELIGGSVPATEHSVMCAGSKEGERDTTLRLLKKYSAGILSLVSDTWDFWKMLREILPSLKNEIMTRDGKLVIRPDSGDPVKIICGDPDAAPGSDEYKGAMTILWEEFGGTKNDKGYKMLDSHVGLIYGDSITLDRLIAILEGLKRKKFASTNIVFGIGSFTYVFNTRDTHGWAMKATNVVIDGVSQEIFKDPITGGWKRSAKGLLRVDYDEEGEIRLFDQQTEEQEKQGLLQTVFLDGKLMNTQTLADIRALVHGEFAQY